jgi:pimeloyl-ACP methyl ester carboxylesterase
VLRDWWKAAIEEGLSRNCGSEGLDADFKMVYWADLLYPQPLEADAASEIYVPAAGSGPLPRSGTGVGPLGATLLEQGVGKVLERVFGVSVGEGVIRDALKAKMPDLYEYRHRPDTHRAIRERLVEVLRQVRGGDRPIMLVAHSMGSLIAYDVFKEAARILPELRLSHLVTAGSPLGLVEVKEICAGPPRVPECVARWSNLADPRDWVARWDTQLADEYPPNSKGVTVDDRLVVNGYVCPSGKGNPHKVFGYLRTPEMSELIIGFTERRG